MGSFSTQEIFNREAIRCNSTIATTPETFMTTMATTTTKSASGWAILLSLISLSTILPLKQRKKKF